MPNEEQSLNELADELFKEMKRARVKEVLNDDCFKQPREVILLIGACYIGHLRLSFWIDGISLIALSTLSYIIFFLAIYMIKHKLPLRSK